MAPHSFPLGQDKGLGTTADLSEEISSQTFLSPHTITHFQIPDLSEESRRCGTSTSHFFVNSRCMIILSHSHRDVSYLSH